MTASPPVRLAIDAGIATVTLDRPGARNALSLEMMDAIAAALAEADADRGARVVLLAATPPAFCAGHDLREMTAHRADADGGRAHFQAVFAACSALMQQIGALSRPVIAVVEGVATAAGCQLVASCDLAVADAGARFATPGVDIGLFCTTPSVALTRALAPKHAMEMLLTGAMIDAETAVRIGLVNRVAPAGGAAAAARALAAQIAAKSPEALRTGKRAVQRQRALPLAEAYLAASAVMVDNMLAPDAIEGIGAFLEKRPPDWPSG